MGAGEGSALCLPGLSVAEVFDSSGPHCAANLLPSELLAPPDSYVLFYK